MTVLYDHNQSLGYLTGLASRLFNNLLAIRFQQADVDITIEQLHLEKSSANRLTDGLERRGWIIRSKAPDDSRKKRVTPTPQALAIINRCAAITSTALQDVQQGITEEEQRLYRSLQDALSIT